MTWLSDSALDHLRRVTEAPDLTGTRYQIEGELGRGGMGVVYRARDPQLGRAVALKVVDGASATALDEARIAAQLEHPGIVPLYDAGELPDGRFFYVMKLVTGPRLDAFIAGPAALFERLRVFLKICDAVEFAHSRGVVHRDLKPQNVMVGVFGEVLVTDWGVAGAVLGTPGYMAPERAAGGGDTRADIYSLGAILRDVAKDGGSRPLVAIAAKAMAADPRERYAAVVALAADVERFMERLPVSAYRENVWERAQRFGGRNAALLLLLAAYVGTRIVLYFFR